MSEQGKSNMAIMLADEGDVMDSAWAEEEGTSESMIPRDSCLQVSGRRAKQAEWTARTKTLRAGELGMFEE